MSVTVAITCSGCHKMTACQSSLDGLKPGELCVIENSKGVFLGKVCQCLSDRSQETDAKCECKLLRKATPEDIENGKRNVEMEKKAFDFCIARIGVRQLEMKLVSVEYLLDGTKAVFYFTADGRVDFRELVRDLAYELRTRIEMKQIGVRDEAKMLGGLGSCGQDLCCATFLKDFEPVSIRMAKIQNLTLDPTKISGVCGRLMCCLGYEYDTYEKVRKTMPKIGETLTINGKSGMVRSLDALKEIVFVQFQEDETVKYALADIKPFLKNSRKSEAESKDAAIKEELSETEEKIQEEAGKEA